jgi:hypothetical protein
VTVDPIDASSLLLMRKSVDKHWQILGAVRAIQWRRVKNDSELHRESFRQRH